MSNTPELLPCPFCGGEPELKAPYRNVAICTECLARGPVGKEADEAWNRRAALQSAADTPSPVVPRCGVVGWPPLKKAIWDHVIAANLNSGKYISAWELTDSLYAAALAATATEDPLSPFKAKEE